jgi:hypothetical protein
MIVKPLFVKRPIIVRHDSRLGEWCCDVIFQMPGDLQRHDHSVRGFITL